MAAPSGTKWGNVVGDYGKIGIYASATSTDTQSKLSVEVWFWSKYSVSDSNNSLYFCNGDTFNSALTNYGSITVKTGVDTGSGWSTSNQKRLGGWSATYNKTTSTQTRYLHAKLSGIDRVGGDMEARMNFVIPALTSYKVSYNANGGTGAPADQTKWLDIPLTLSSVEPTRQGYEFQGWGASATATSVVNYPGGTFDGNYAYTYYAIWKANTYVVSYNANGGTGAPGNQTKTYGQPLVLSTTIPTRTGYIFLGWGTSNSDTTVDYNSGATYTNNSDVTLYAIWAHAEYTISYDANSGIGAPDNQIKYHDITLTLSSTIPTKEHHNFKGWSISPTSNIVSYSANGSYVNNANITLYAVWEYAYRKPTIANLQVSRCKSDGSPSENDADFTSGKATFDWSTYYEVTDINILCTSSTGETIKSISIPDITGTNGVISVIFGDDLLPSDQAFNVTITVSDKEGSMSKNITLEGFIFVIDMLGGGKGVAFGRAAEIENVADFDFEIKARKNINADSELNVAGKSTLSGGVDTTTIGCKAINASDKSGFSGGIDTSTVNCYSIEMFHATPYIDFHFAKDGGDYTSRIIEYERGKLSTENWRVTNTLTLGGVSHTGNNKILWAASSLLTADSTISLSEAISAQPHGVILVFSCYSSDTVQDWGWATHVIPKSFVANHPGGGIDIPLMRQSASVVGCKYVYVSDTTLRGHADNVLTGTATTGVKFNNGYWVLRYVIGI